VGIYMTTGPLRRTKRSLLAEFSAAVGRAGMMAEKLPSYRVPPWTAATRAPLRSLCTFAIWLPWVCGCNPGARPIAREEHIASKWPGMPWPSPWLVPWWSWSWLLPFAFFLLTSLSFRFLFLSELCGGWPGWWHSGSTHTVLGETRSPVPTLVPYILDRSWLLHATHCGSACSEAASSSLPQASCLSSCPHTSFAAVFAVDESEDIVFSVVEVRHASDHHATTIRTVVLP